MTPAKERRTVRRTHSDESGQMAVEFAVVLPILLAIAVVAVNAGTLFVQCASFDRVARNAVRVCASAPPYGQGVDAAASQVESMIESALNQPNVRVSVLFEETHGGHVVYTARMEFAPTLFGMGLRMEVLGVSLPVMTHEVSMVVDRYKPGVVI